MVMNVFIKPTLSFDQSYSATFFSRYCAISRTASDMAATHSAFNPEPLNNAVTASTANDTQLSESSNSAPPHNHGCNIWSTLCNVSRVVDVKYADDTEDSDFSVVTLWKKVAWFISSCCCLLAVSVVCSDDEHGGVRNNGALAGVESTSAFTQT